MRHRFLPIPLVMVCLFGWIWQLACHGPRARSPRSFDEIRVSVTGKTAAEVTRILGEPDTRQVILDHDERWIWWNYTFLDGQDHPPEKRGTVVHLEIVFRNPSQWSDARRPYHEWQVDETFGVSFKEPAQDG